METSPTAVFDALVLSESVVPIILGTLSLTNRPLVMQRPMRTMEK